MEGEKGPYPVITDSKMHPYPVLNNFLVKPFEWIILIFEIIGLYRLIYDLVWFLNIYCAYMGILKKYKKSNVRIIFKHNENRIWFKLKNQWRLYVNLIKHFTFVVLFYLEPGPTHSLPWSQTFFSCAFPFLEKLVGPGCCACSAKWINWFCLTLLVVQ